MAMSRHAIIALSFALLVACGTSPPVHYYTLSQPAAEILGKTDGTIVALGPFTVPDYLQKPYIVIREKDQRIHFSEYQRWAEVPQDALTAWLASDVDSHLATATVVGFPSASFSQADYRVRGAIAQWDVDTSGTAVLVVQWDCRARDGTSLLPLRTSRYTAQASKVDDYSSIVRALNETAAAFGRDITTALAAALPGKPSDA
jgi:uncharacterized protein